MEEKINYLNRVFSLSRAPFLLGILECMPPKNYQTDVK